MKNVVLILFICLMFSCDNESEAIIEDVTNKVALLKVDFETNTFEGGKELEFPIAESFTISSTYIPPGDFGDVQLYYSEVNEKIFDGTIIWMGTGETSYPEEINSPENFLTISENVEMPASSDFKPVMYNHYPYYYDNIDYSSIWNAIGNLELIKNYRETNPQGKINLFLYTPSVGFGNPAEWDWYIYIKN